MQKRKAPVFLFGLVIAMVAGVVIWNASSKPAAEPGSPEASHDEEQVKEAGVTQQQRQQATSELAAALPQTKPASPKPGDKKPAVGLESPGSSMELASEPTILLMKFTPYKPKPNDNSTSTHWYEEESRAAMISEANKKSKS